MKSIFKLIPLISLLVLSGCGNNNNSNQSNNGSEQSSDNIVRTINFSRDYISLETDDSYQINYTLDGFLEGEEHLIEWTSEDENIASVDDLGFVYGNGVGVTTIKASYLGAEDTLTVTVVSSGEVPTFDCLEKVEVYVNENISFNEETRFRGQKVDADYTYTSSDPSVVEIKNNEIKSLKEGTADITITSSYHNYENVRVCIVKVVPHVEIILNHEALNLATASYQGSVYIKEATLTAEAYINDKLVNVVFNWTSKDNNVATVNNGLVKSVNEGQTFISCSFVNEGKTYSKDIVINVKTPTNYIEELYAVNMREANKYIDLTSLGLNASGLTSIMMKDDENYAPISFTVNGDKAVISINDSFKGLTKEFRLEINGEYYFINVCFKDYVKDKLYFADSAEHLSNLTALNTATISYDASKSITSNDVKGADKDNYVNEQAGSTKIQLTGRNEEAVIINNPEIANISKYNYIVFYIYTEVSGYKAGTWVTEGIILEPHKWNKVIVDDFSKVMDQNGNMLTDKHYDPTGFGVRFTNYESPTKKDVMWLSSIYVGAKPDNRIITMGVGLVPTTWWVNGVKVTTTASYVDYYGHISTTVGVNIDDLMEQDKPYLKYEDSSCMEITYGGVGDITGYFYPGKYPLNGYTDLVFYVMTETERANEMSVASRQKVHTANLIKGHWTRVHFALKNDRITNNEGKVIYDEQNLNGFLFIIKAGGKAPEGTKFYVSSIYGFNY